MIKKVLDDLKQGIKFIFQKYPVTVFLIILLSILSCITDLDRIEFSIRIYAFLSLFTLGVLFSELTFKKKIIKYCAFGAFFLISLLLNYCIFDTINDVLDLKIVIPYAIIIYLLILYRFYKNSKMSIKEYFLSTFINVFKTTLICYIIVLGTALVTGIFSTLILGNFAEELLLKMYILSIGLFYIPNILNDLSGRKVNSEGFFKVIIHYVLDSFLILCFAIVYIYILKIIITWDMPTNEVFRILAILFIIGLPIWIMNDFYKDDLISQINKYLPIAFIPFIILEIYSLMLRIIDCGITIPRYFGIILIIFQIIYILIHLFKKEKLEYCYLVLIGLTIISFSTPFINAFDVSNRSQVNMIKHYIVKGELTSKEKGRIMDAYNYLNNNNWGSEYIKKYLINDELKIINIIHEISDANEDKTIYINEQISDISVNTDEYSHMESFKINLNSPEEIIITYNNHDVDIIGDIREYIDMKEKGIFHNYFMNNNYIILENAKIVITKLNLSYRKNINYIDIEGFVLWR